MANLKDISAESMVARIDAAEERALEDVRRVAQMAREEVEQAAQAAAADVPGLTELAARADIAFVIERVFGDHRGAMFKGEPAIVTEEFLLNHGNGWGGPIGRASFRPGRYRLLLFGLRIGDAP